MTQKIGAAGILYTTGTHVLFARRGNGSDFPNMWALPGGRIEDGETPVQAAVRECLEELRYPTIGELTDLGTQTVISDADDGAEVEFTTFQNVVPEQFQPILNYENDAWEWVPIGAWPKPLHPGVAKTLAEHYPPRTELEVAEAIRDGRLSSPQLFENVVLVALRITGTGMAWRNPKKAELEANPEAKGQYVFRDPQHYMTDEFLRRSNGLTVILEHPEGLTLTSDEFKDRVIGSIFVPYLKHEEQEVWGIAKIYDAPSIDLIIKEQLSTSPTVDFCGSDENSIIMLADGSELLLEGKPSLLDHLAVCYAGVWDKGGEPSGIEITQGVSEMDMNVLQEMIRTAVADAINKQQGHVGKRVTAKADSEDKPEKEAKADSDDEDADKKADSDDADKKADSDDGDKTEDKKADDNGEKPTDPMQTAADKKADSVAGIDPQARARIAELESRVASAIKALPKDRTDADYRAMAGAQEAADRVAHAFGDAAPRPLSGESLIDYRKRLVNKFKQHSPDYKEIDITSCDAPMLDIVERRVYADAMTAANSPAGVEAGTLREVISQDETGRRIKTFVGDVGAWTNQFKSPRKVVRGFNTQQRSM